MQSSESVWTLQPYHSATLIQMAPSISFQGGTLVLRDVAEDYLVHSAFQWIKGRWRCEAYHYPILGPWLKLHKIRDRIPRWQTLKLTLHGDRQPHDYQREALGAWHTSGRLGSIVLPTGAGKTFVAIQGIHQVKRSTVVVAPTIDLLHQWYARLVNAFDMEIGVYYGGEKNVQPITVTTYHSAGDLIADYGNQFKLVIYDEVHHLPAPNWGETALMSPAPHRLGLTATYPDEPSDIPPPKAESQPQPPPEPQPVDYEAENSPQGRTLQESSPTYTVSPTSDGAGRWHVDTLIGPIVYQKPIDELIGTRLAEYRTERVRVNLTDGERQQYDADYAIYSGFFRSRRLWRSHGPNWLQELMRLSAFDREARRALLARQRIQRLLAGSEAKLAMLDKLLREHIHEQVLIFTENNEVVYQIARRHLIPALTHETKAAERKHILEAFQAGTYQAIVTSKVLNEGIDVPEAKVAIVLGGSAGAREYIQRLGRVLRKVGNRKAILFEIIVRKTVEEGRARRRRPKKK